MRCRRHSAPHLPRRTDRRVQHAAHTAPDHTTELPILMGWMDQRESQRSLVRPRNNRSHLSEPRARYNPRQPCDRTRRRSQVTAAAAVAEGAVEGAVEGAARAAAVVEVVEVVAQVAVAEEEPVAEQAV
jgi:hypothetical protein